MFNETGELSEVLKAGLEGALAQFAEWEFVGVVADIFQDGVEMILVEDELHQALSRDWEVALDIIFIVFIVISSAIFAFVALLNEGVLLGLGCWLFVAIVPVKARLVLEFLLEVCESIFEGLRPYRLRLSRLSNTAPACVGVVVLALLTFEQLQEVELVIVIADISLVQRCIENDSIVVHINSGIFEQRSA